jgi:ribosome-binding factor A
MGKDELNEEIQAGLRKAKGFVRRELGHRLQLRFVPEIMFVHDKSFGYGNRIERLLAEISKQEEGHD